jgi:hypothetical protein
MTVLNEIPFHHYLETQWATIRHEFCRVGIDPDAVTLNYERNWPMSVRHALEAKARVYLGHTLVFSKQHKSQREMAPRAVELSQNLRATIPVLNLKCEAYLTRVLKEFEDICKEDVIQPTFSSEELGVDDLVRGALEVYAEAIAKVFPDKKPRYKDGGADGRTVGFLHAALCPVLGKHLTKQALDIRVRRLTKNNSYVRRHRDGECFRELKIERMKKIVKSAQENPEFVAREKKADRREEEIKLKNDYPHEFANMCVLSEYSTMEESLSKALASHPEALAIARATLRELSEPPAERVKEWIQRCQRIKAR